MKLMIASDIHGSAKWCEKLLDALETERPHRLLLLGDLLYHGPRNDLPEDYAPKRVIQMLCALRPRPLCVRGNCEAEVDQMVLDFPVLADYGVLFVDGRTIYMTHGHIHNADNPPAPGPRRRAALRPHPRARPAPPGALHLPEPRLRIHPQRQQSPQLLHAGKRPRTVEGPGPERRGV